jgi:phenylalanyl-tRNA synthetase beta chain
MGFTEALTFALCSTDDCFSKMRRVDDGNSAVVISNPKTDEFQVVALLWVG